MSTVHQRLSASNRPYDAETIVWNNGVVAASGTLASDSLTIANNLIVAIKAASYSSKIKYLLPLLGSLTPLLLHKLEVTPPKPPMILALLPARRPS